ncbi:glycosyltransferase family 2 protein [Zhongshania aquimaris]|uniref:Glycosyltransferase family 2 protein n=1 Tax=Zhongshania aquimaris TaxID=2857107 RepID=A0ABS6VPT0_9GAMM|nr:glycosyltransferase family 2 protein [Zhongshania aquimaris]
MKKNESSSLKPVPEISVILPVYNRIDGVRDAIFSVLNQSFTNFELIIVDDGSEVDVESQLALFNDPRLVYIRRPRNGGVAAARNTGIANAKAPYIAFQDSDDLWLPGKLKAQFALVKKYKTLVIGRVIRVCGKKVIQYCPDKRLTKGYLDYNTVAAMRSAYVQSWILPAKLLSDAGGFRESLSVWEDYDLLLRLSKDNRVIAVGDWMVLSPQGEDSLTKNRALFAHALSDILTFNKENLIKNKKVWALLNYTCSRLYLATGNVGSSRRFMKEAFFSMPFKLSYYKFYIGALFASQKTQIYLASMNEDWNG